MSISAILVANIMIFNIYNKNQIIYSEAKYIADFNDDRKVSWFADNVFVWKVIENVWTIEENWEWPNTSFKVHILYNIKWDVNWDIDIIQEWWYFKNWNLLVVEWNKLLEIWNTYLFTTRGKDFIINSHKNWHHFLFSNDDISKEKIHTLISENKTVQDLREAYKNEVYFEGNFKISSEKNAYKDLSPQEKIDYENIDYGFLKK